MPDQLDDGEKTKTWTNSQQVIAYAVVSSFIVVIFVWMLFPPKAIDQAAFGIINMLIGVLVAKFTTIVDYTFGSSAESKNKGDAQTRTIDRLTSTFSGTGSAAIKEAAKEAAPAAAKEAAPPAADVAAPPAAEAAVAEAFAKRDHPGGGDGHP